jgi:tRNA(fMet)-specific endonuclease VapC
LSATKDDLTCEQNLYARHLYLLVHHARAAGSRAEAPGAGGAARPAHRGLGHHLFRNALRRHRPEGLAAPRQLVDAFCARLDAILPWDRAAVDATTEIKVALRLAGTPIGPNDTAIAGHAIAAGAVLVTNNTREFERVPGLVLEDWVR